MGDALHMTLLDGRTAFCRHVHRKKKARICRASVLHRKLEIKSCQCLDIKVSSVSWLHVPFVLEVFIKGYYEKMVASCSQGSKENDLEKAGIEALGGHAISADKDGRDPLNKG